MSRITVIIDFEDGQAPRAIRLENGILGWRDPTTEGRARSGATILATGPAQFDEAAFDVPLRRAMETLAGFYLEIGLPKKDVMAKLMRLAVEAALAAPTGLAHEGDVTAFVFPRD